METLGGERVRAETWRGHSNIEGDGRAFSGLILLSFLKPSAWFEPATYDYMTDGRSPAEYESVLTGWLISVPVKEIRCYRLARSNDQIEATACSKAETFNAHNADVITGEPIPVEGAVVYCDA